MLLCQYSKWHADKDFAGLAHSIQSQFAGYNMITLIQPCHFTSMICERPGMLTACWCQKVHRRPPDKVSIHNRYLSICLLLHLHAVTAVKHDCTAAHGHEHCSSLVQHGAVSDLHDAIDRTCWATGDKPEPCVVCADTSRTWQSLRPAFCAHRTGNFVDHGNDLLDYHKGGSVVHAEPWLRYLAREVMCSIMKLLSECTYAIVCALFEWVKFVFYDIADHTQIEAWSTHALNFDICCSSYLVLQLWHIRGCLCHMGHA